MGAKKKDTIEGRVRRLGENFTEQITPCRDIDFIGNRRMSIDYLGVRIDSKGEIEVVRRDLTYFEGLSVR